jgi:hypothetical protein
MTYQTDTSIIPLFDTVPKKYKNGGLKNKRKAEKDPPSQPAASVAFGGLDDEHIEQENPFPVLNNLPRQVEYPPNLGRDTSCKNTVSFCRSSFTHQDTDEINTDGLCLWRSSDRVFGRANLSIPNFPGPNTLS